eukprot:Protomagalhaensia_wolfi_Nauph_80__5729@NODE_68_length_4033_cov_20_317977_g54_i0_p1_GENE_NODE_68_length_4033_cov_20_317977_g54_i0NODE_68_length_4033_cov_20_317977_g54_i0_p1_ORF_typecomplete_len491_score86_20Metallophos/PF00149_28/5_5e37Metallophos_2/PF12850_7/7_2e05_NODE_68_length_4033_cov_20_317977_g54_i05452017
MELLPDPLHDRQVKEVEPPPAKPLSEALLFPNGLDGNPDWRALQSHCFREGRVAKEHCLHIIRRVSAITSCEPNLLRLQDPITVVGDIHGQYYDLMKLLEIGGDPDTTQYLFLGDYVDRGSFSIEVLLVLYALKLNRPNRVWLLRGNHECRQMTAFFNFRDECEYKYDTTVYQAFMESFDTLSLAAVINNRFLALHGGLSPVLHKKENIGNINRFQEPPRAGVFCDLLWADPADDEREDHPEMFFPNDVRGCSFFFTYEAAKAFLDNNSLLSIIRAHEAQLEGYKMHRADRATHFPTVITIFSAPNYCDCYNNKGAILKFDSNTLNIQQFNFSPHPYHLPNFMDVFTWSIPFVSEKVTEMLYTILNPTMEDDDNDLDMEGLDSLPEEIEVLSRAAVEAAVPPPAEARKSTISPERAEALRRKVYAVGRLMRVLRTLREQNELIVRLKGVTPGHRIPPGALIRGEEGLQSELQKFLSAKELDAINERRPQQ